MIETLPVRPLDSDLVIDAKALEGFNAFQDRILGRSQIVWAEHCSECAYPKCYETCAFYTPRPDLHCRRFEAGIEPVPAGGPTRLHRIRFRRWGKLEGRGATAIAPLAQARRNDHRDARMGGVLAMAPAPYALGVGLAARWNLAKEARASRPGVLKPEAFVVECWSANGQRQPFTLTILNVGEHAVQLFQAPFEAGPDYQRLTVPIRNIEGHVDLAAPFLIQIEPIGEAAGRDVVFGVCDFVTLKPAETAPGDADARPVKVVVWDLDETLWTGVLAEDGAQGVKARPETVAAIRALDERGVLQSIASKNDASEALAALAGFGLTDFFLHPQIHWNPKSQSVADIAAALDLGVDSFVFVDDQPFERGEVAARHPSVRLMAHTEVGGMLDHPWFDLPVTPESRQRRGLYQAEATRAAAFQSTGTDYLAFLRGCAIRADVRPLDGADAERVHELSQRTNQLNFRGAKYAREDVQAMLAADPDSLRLTVRCADRFGDYGLIGFITVDLRRGEITDLFMSCRVQRKRVEQAVFAWIAAQAIAAQAISGGRQALTVRHVPTKRNGASRAMLEDLGFAEAETIGEAQIWRRDLARPFDDADIVTVVTASTHAEPV
ncbi:MAG TPA: HAD-IIIC family phosphatase [Caulobacteraceae bacterium]|jgi:FkbH-like protein|nr:HAD-IIIC family phosphatase [Caulobacteraceae bacterium]